MKRFGKIILLFLFIFAVSGIHDLHCEHSGCSGDGSCPFAFLTQGHYSLSLPVAFEDGLQILAKHLTVFFKSTLVTQNYTYARTLRSPPLF